MPEAVSAPPADESAATPQAPPELFSQEGLKAHARTLATLHVVTANPRKSRPLLPNLDQSAERLEDAYQLLSSAARSETTTLGSEDWLRDNYHVVQDQVREIRQDLPRKYYLELPKLADGPFEGYPRVYVLARELIAHTAARFDLETLVDFATAYQTHAPLTIGEIWAVPIMLRLGLLEELCRLAGSVVTARGSRTKARTWERRLRADRPGAPSDLETLLRTEVRAHGRLSAALVVELLLWLRDQPSSAAPSWDALQSALEAQGDSAEELLRAEHQREAADQVAIGNVIMSMRLLSSLDWPVFFDRVSLVEQILRTDPVDAYGQMDFPTRDRYRHSIEQLARRSKHPEPTVAQRAVHLAAEAKQLEPQTDRRHHVGYYLISRGRFLLERDLQYRPTVREQMARFIFAHPAIGYLGTIALAIAVGVASLIAYAARHGATPGGLWLVGLIVLVPVSELAISLLNAMLTSQVPPRQLPKLAMRDGIPAGARTIVVVPAIIDNESRVDTLLHDLEVRFFANRDPHLHFALLSDFADADRASMPGDDDLIELARRRVDEMNGRHGQDRFLFLHRERRWNPREQRWMGWERKRGKLDELNRLLRGAGDTSYVVQHGDLSILASVRYVITLDSDTQLPMEAGLRLVGTLSHPLNRPRFDPRLQRVTEGYAILQPRVGVGVESANRTTFAQVFAGHVGVDPYTTAVSDVYQDLFHEGSFVGKGIYDVDAFQSALTNRVPENALLSHDLFEGLYARAGLCTDIHLVDDYPSHYLAYAARQHRWVRGDWQIARWLWRTVPDGQGRLVPNTLSAVARWKILDNLRRSLIAPSLLALLALGWMVLPGSSLLWTILALLVLAFPAYVQVGRSLSSRVRGVPLTEHIRAERDTVVTSVRQAFLSTVLVAHQSWVMLDAIGRTLVRLFITRRALLQWISSDHRTQTIATERDVLRSLWPVSMLALGLGALVATVAPGRLVLALPILTLWFICPALVYATGRPLSHGRPAMSRSDRIALRKLARRTWRFFEDMVVAEGHWLIPDNYQEDRREQIAHRTSPTNIGLQLLSTLAAHDLGYASITSVLDRLEPVFDTLLRMNRYRGHFYNWYDTRTLAPLPPAYISTVDSGNLAGYLLTLRIGLIDLGESEPIVSASFLEGLTDLVDLCDEEIARTVTQRGSAKIGRAVRQELAGLRAQIETAPDTLDGWSALLPQLADRLVAAGLLGHDFAESLAASTTLDSARQSAGEAAFWLERASHVVAERRDELRALTAWIPLVPPATQTLPPGVPSLAQLVEWCDLALTRIGDAAGSGDLRARIEGSRRHAAELAERAERLGILADDLIEETEFGFLFNADRQLFSIGYNVADGRLDSSYYDTLASEARLASFMAIATGKVSHDHWFRLGRSLTPSGSSRALLSWSASMFEYLMPLLVMRAYPGTLLAETYRAVVQRQIQYGAQRGVPWGISESAYYAQDLEGNYQYRAFGVPGLGLKRGLADELVVAPYATVLAAPLVPSAAVSNLERLRAEGLAGKYGFFDAIDYTVARLPPDRIGGVPLPTFMAHHQGMSLVALDNLLNDAPMQARFHGDPRVQSADVLLQERVPHLVPLRNPPIEKADHVPSARQLAMPPVRRYVTPHTLSPRSHLLSNGSYTVMVTNAGGGYSRRQSLAMTRWREDITTDHWGSFCYVRDVDSGQVWSTTYQPTRREPDEYEATFAPDRAVWRRVDGGIELRTEVVVSPEDDVELRRVSLTNHTREVRTLELTSYAEVVLAPGDADLAHPAFSNLFVETTALPELDGLICARRPRASGADRPHLIHVVSGAGKLAGATEYETDRMRFVGRGRTLAEPIALFGSPHLSNTTGPVLDPIVSLRRTVRLPPNGTARLSFATGFADSAETARRLIEKYHDRRAVARALALASTHAQIELRHLALTVDDTILFQRLGGRLLYGDPRLRSRDAVEANVRGQADLWKYGISGDLPMLVVRLTDTSEIPLLRELLKAHEYLRLKGFAFDLVVLNEHATSYLQDLHNALSQLVESSPEKPWLDKPGGVFLRRLDLMTPEDHVLLRATARAVMDGADGNLTAQLTRPQMPVPVTPPPLAVARPFDKLRAGLRDAAPSRAITTARTATPPADLEFFNGIGGFADGGREYVIHVEQRTGSIPPAPWSNVVAHPTFGFAATECGPGYTWSGNSHDNRLTPWCNDPVSDPPGEAVFIRDNVSGRAWSATPLPSGDGHPYTVRHGQGYTEFEHVRDGLSSRLRLFVPAEDPVKIFEITVRNAGRERRSCSVTIYVDWVLGENATRARHHVVTSREPATGALLARNVFRQDFSHRVAFLDLDQGDRRTITGDRMEFIGRNRTLARPAALEREALSDRVGGGVDPCGAVQVRFALEPSEERTLIGLLGEAENAADARTIVQRYRGPNAVTEAFERVRGFWNGVVSSVEVRTPDRSMDLLLNRWLPYQTLACRIWGRSAFYQSSGAFGFRDQLQDVLALMLSRPEAVRAHVLHAASRQFTAGDVQHWWHEPGGQGVRTRFSDDRLWLVSSTLQYIAATGDRTVLDEEVPFLDGRELNPGEHEAYERPTASNERAVLYEHCVRAIVLNLEVGAHGLPLMGIGDWNDGMNHVGAEGRGESVWLAWFLVSILGPFADVAAARGEADRADQYRRHAARLIDAIEQAWDGEWYRRAYFDDGTPLGSRQNDECRIDAIAQSWAVLTGRGDQARARQAMESSDAHLVRREDRLVLLLTPPFDHMSPSPGYIQGYVPGVRENGGQYTHAALWTALAFARLGDGNRAMELFSIINPINHARTPRDVAQYRVEPYVVAADVYSRAPHVGRGGWTWYTGSAGWMYRVGVEGLLGLTLRDGALVIDPCIPREWPGYTATVRIGGAVIEISVENPEHVNRGVRRLEVDGVETPRREITLTDVSGTRRVRVVLGVEHTQEPVHAEPGRRDRSTGQG